MKRPRVGLALSGGAARCIGHIGVLEALESEGIAIDLVAGTSGGAMVAALYAMGVPVRQLKEMAFRLSWRGMVQPVFTKQGLISSKNLLRFITRRIGSVDFKDLKIPLAVVASDLKSGEKVVIRDGSVAQAVTASCSLPVIFSPVVIQGKVLVDGGMSSNLPVLTLIENLGATWTIAVDVNDKELARTKLNNLFQIGIHTVSLIGRKNSAVEKKYADATINVDASGISLLDLKKGHLMIRRGFAAAEKQIPYIKKSLSDRSVP